MRRLALLLVVLLAEGVCAWQFGGTVGVDKFPVSQMVFRGIDLDRELGMEYDGPEYGIMAGVKVCRPWRDFILSVSLEKLDHGENSINWQDTATTPGVEIAYSGSGSFPAWSAGAALAYPLTKLKDWSVALQTGISLLYSNVWLERQENLQAGGQEFVTYVHGTASGVGFGSNNSLILSREWGAWRLALEAGYRLAHVTVRGTTYQEMEGYEEEEPEHHRLLMDVDYDGPFFKIGFIYQH